MKSLIAIVVIIGFAAVAGSIIVGTESFDGIVTEHPYEDGLLWDEIRNKENKLGWRTKIQNREFFIGDNDVLISVLDKNSRPLARSEVTLMISRPANAEYDKLFDNIHVKDGLFKTVMHFPLYGYWDIKIDVLKGEDVLSFKKRLFVEKAIH